MDLNRFKDCAAAYGKERRRWPAQELELYDRFARTPEGAAILAQAERTDRFLDAFVPAAPDPGLARRVGVPAKPAWRRFGAPAAALAASAALGFAVGFAQVRDEIDADPVARLLLGPQSVQEIGL
jgi:ferric-dicitrate binding protein FerR (iron transport regulator)